MTVEVPEERVEKAMRRTARQLARDISVPGFRRGKVPYNVLVRRIGRATLRAEAIEDVIPPVFEEAVEQIEADMYGQPSLDDLEAEPLVLKFTVPLSPQVGLGDYRSIRKELEPVEVSEEAVDEALEQVRIRHQKLEAVDRAVEQGDVVTVSGFGRLAAEEKESETAVDETGEETAEDVEDENDEVLFDEESIDLLMDSDKLFPGTPFVDNIIGLSVGDETSFSFVFPEDYEEEKELAGREATFDVTVLNVKERELPELDDELAKQEGDYETVAELREDVRDELEREAESQAENELLEEMIDDLLADADIVYPPAAVEAEIDDMVEAFKDQIVRSGWQWEDYLTIQSETEESVREQFRDNAVERLQRRLALRQFILEEKLTVEAEDVDSAIEERVGRFGDNEELRENMRNYYSSGYGFDMISSEVLMDKVHQRIEAIVTGNAPDLQLLESEAEEATAAEEVRAEEEAGEEEE
jgi:trigger factor